MLRSLNSAAADFDRRLRELLSPPGEDLRVRRRVAAIFRRVRREGASALLALTAEYDGWSPPSAAALEAPAEKLARAADAISPALRAALCAAAERLRDYHRRQLSQSWSFVDAAGNEMGEFVRPVRRAVVYAPGGKAAYPSSVLMGVVPAVVAGAAEVIVTTPAPGGEAAPATLAAAAIAGANRVFLLGGAQAIAAFAYGAAPAARADVIVGPGNAYVAEAKRQAFGLVGVDSIAGPSEILIISDGAAPADWVAADLAAQAEHDEDAQCVIVSPNAAHLREVEAALAAQAPDWARADIIRASLARRGAQILARDMEDCVRIANIVAPEHLQVMTENAPAVADRVVNAGGVFIGAWSCVPFGDYAAGPNHVLPTNGAARFASPLGARHFIKRAGFLRASEGGAKELAALCEPLALAEGLPAHAAAARRRRQPPVESAFSAKISPKAANKKTPGGR